MRDITQETPIGMAFTKPMRVLVMGEEVEYPGETFCVIEIIEHNNQKIYVTNRWYKPGVPQILHENLVHKYVELPKENNK